METPTATSPLSTIIRQMVLQPVARAVEMAREAGPPEISPSNPVPPSSPAARSESTGKTRLSKPGQERLEIQSTFRSQPLPDQPGAVTAPAVKPPKDDDRAQASRSFASPNKVMAETPRLNPRTERIPPLAEKPAQSPTINITIGRVEVRATSEPAPKAAKQQPQPDLMSLDDYLAQRAGGKT